MLNNPVTNECLNALQDAGHPYAAEALGNDVSLNYLRRALESSDSTLHACRVYGVMLDRIAELLARHGCLDQLPLFVRLEG